MASHNDSNKHEGGHESTDAKPKPLLLFGLIIVGVCVATFIGVFILMNYWGVPPAETGSVAKQDDPENEIDRCPHHEERAIEIQTLLKENRI